MTAPMTPEREALVRVLQDAVWPFLAHDPADPDLFWGQMARKVEEHYAAEVDRLRAQVREARGWVLNAVDPVVVGRDVKQRMLDKLALASGGDS